jgi:putative redox protein
MSGNETDTLAAIGAEGLRTDIIANGHRIIGDEPESAGGTNTGPSPYDLLSAALGSCTAMTLRLYANRKKWPLEGVVVRVKHDKIHAADCAECETKVGMIDRLDREIELNGPLDDAQRQQLLAIANKCPVHKTLTSEVRIQTRLK